MSKIGIITKAKRLRKESTEAERLLWKELRGYKLGVKWRRQHPVDMYILDFYSSQLNLAIEIDGSLHKIKENKEYDKMREKYLKNRNIKIIRFWNSEVKKDLNKVLKKIRKHCASALIEI